MLSFALGLKLHKLKNTRTIELIKIQVYSFLVSVQFETLVAETINIAISFP